MRVTKKAAVLKFYKGPKSNHKVNAILEYLNVKNLDKKTKMGIKKIDNDNYPDSQEFELLKVFMNDEQAHFNQKIVKHNFNYVSNKLINWARISGYSSLFSK